MSEQPLILVVEDEYFLRLDLEQILNDVGFATEAASSGEDALALFVADTRQYKALITDVRMQGPLSGWDVARLLREEEPALPVIYVTGSSAEEWASHGVPDSVLIQKPFARAQLINAVTNLLKMAAS